MEEMPMSAISTVCRSVLSRRRLMMSVGRGSIHCAHDTASPVRLAFHCDNVADACLISPYQIDICTLHESPYTYLESCPTY